MAAMSPARSRLGPLVTEMPTSISPARMRHSDVLPSPGGPASSMWSRGSPRLFAASTKILKFSFSASCPMNSSRERGRSVGSSSSASVLAEAVRAGRGPAAIVLGEPDLILAIGAAVAEELYGVRVPVVVLSPAELATIRDGEPYEVRTA